jgi:hypothetical protein
LEKIVEKCDLMADTTESLMGIIPVVVAGGVTIGLTKMMLDDKKDGFMTSLSKKSEKSMSLLDSVK